MSGNMVVVRAELVAARPDGLVRSYVPAGVRVGSRCLLCDSGNGLLVEAVLARHDKRLGVGVYTVDEATLRPVGLASGSGGVEV